MLGRAKVEAERLVQETADCRSPGEQEGGATLGCAGGCERQSAWGYILKGNSSMIS